MSYPEFKDVERVKNLLGLFEPEGDGIKDLIPTGYDGATDNRLKVYIGDESDGGKLSEASIVFCSMPVGKKNTVFGILGPKRMDYRRAADALTSLAQTIKTMTDGDNKE